MAAAHVAGDGPVGPGGLTAVLDLAGGGEYPVESGISADPATRGRVTIRFPVTDLPADARITGIIVHGNGAWFRRWFTPGLTAPPGGILSVSFGLGDLRDGDAVQPVADRNGNPLAFTSVQQRITVMAWLDGVPGAYAEPALADGAIEIRCGGCHQGFVLPDGTEA